MEIKPILSTFKLNKTFSMLIIMQVAITLAVMVNAVFLSTEMLKDWNQETGLEYHDLVSVVHQTFDSTIDAKQLLESDQRSIRSIPGIVDISFIRNIPINAWQISKVYRGTGDNQQSFDTAIFNFDEHVADVLQLKLIQGRWFTASEVVWRDDSTPKQHPSVILISENMAKAIFADGNALGQTIWLEQDAAPAKIIGIYSNFLNGERLNSQGQEYHNIIRPLVIFEKGNDPNFLIRTESGQAERLIHEIKDTMYQSTGRYVFSIETLARPIKRMYDGRGSEALYMLLSSTILLTITAFGTAGLVSFLITRRKKQIGIRRALGATKKAIIRYYLLENSLLTWIGFIVGLIIALIINVQLQGRAPFNVIYFMAIVLFIWSVNLLAVWFPAKRAATIPPAIVTRSN